MSDATTIGWVGTGVMGQSMAGRLMDAGFDLVVHTRSPQKAQALRDRGAQWVDDPRRLSETVQIIVTMVGYPSDVEDVYLGSQGILTAVSDNSPLELVIDMTTSSPRLAARIAERADKLGIGCLDAPVSGGDVGARNGTLSIMVGGTEAALEKALPVFDPLGQNVVLQGPAGSGQHTKMVNQVLIATNMIGMCEGLIYARQAGLDPHTVIKSVGSGAAGSWSVNNLAPRILDGDFEPGFFVEHFLKDMSIALEEAEQMGLELPGLKLAKDLYSRVSAAGLGRKGTQALYLALADKSGRAE